jgi:hypothetical protein
MAALPSFCKIPNAYLWVIDHLFNPGGIFSLLGKVFMPYLEAMAAIRLCLSMQYALITAREESNSIIGWEAKV